MPPKITQSEFIQKSKDKYGPNTFDYSLCNYVNSITNITLICNVENHGNFMITPGNHLNKDNMGCKICKEIVYDTHSFNVIATKKHFDRYNYDKVIYTGPKNLVTITCYIHGDFQQKSENHTSLLNGCPSCAGNVRLTTEQFVERAKILHTSNNKPIYDYSQSIYINWDTKVNVTCNKHGVFRVLPENHLRRKSGCPLCHNKTEGIVYDTLKPIYKDLKYGFPKEWCKHERELPFDFEIESLKIIIELDGPQHFRQTSNWRPFEETQDTDKYKMKCANENGYSVIRLLQDDVLYNKINWTKFIDIAIKLLQSYKPINKNIYICTNDEYKPYFVDADKFINELLQIE